MTDRSRPPGDPNTALDESPTLSFRSLTPPGALLTAPRQRRSRIATSDGTPVPDSWTADGYTLVRIHCALSVQLQDDIVRQAGQDAYARFVAWTAACPR